MTTAEIIAMGGLVVAVIALVFNGIQTRRSTKFLQLNILQAERAAESLLLEHQLARGNATMYFTGRFFDLLKEGKGADLQALLNDPNWAYQFWSLQATEFYFFQHSILPLFMYALWMIDLAKVYAGPNGEAVYQLHTKYLQTYSFNYPDMIEFFGEIYNLAKKHNDENLRNRQVWNYVEGWIKNHKQLLGA